ncbi:unnamed protein product [Didymodactylos carnosus]|uniref:PABS domain-containing protein n=1 Tax=Didymodactylos carnosus TaxID=1234261 RepID=A0A814NCY2_9BILA|nr:unnamed protein product [Didymodactylos carnosus]CAF3856029.1 unnamed protein product [Didymodactylos carnosus]
MMGSSSYKGIIFMMSNLVLLIFARERGKMLLEFKSNFSFIRVHQSGSIRDLLLDTDDINYVQSAINLKDPLDPVFEYTTLLLVGLLWNPDPVQVLLIGLGGGVIPRTMRIYYPQTEMDIIEIDPGILRVAQDYFLFKTDSKMNVYIEDARIFVKDYQRKRYYDLIINDAFNQDEGESYAWFK